VPDLAVKREILLNRLSKKSSRTVSKTVDEIEQVLDENDHDPVKLEKLRKTMINDHRNKMKLVKSAALFVAE
jgi:hypothetical protein